jgi:hypothetical protein
MKPDINNRNNDSIQFVQMHSETFYEIIKQVTLRLNQGKNEQKKWITLAETKALLKIKSSTTVLRLRNEGKIRFSNLTNKKIYYDYDSIIEYLESNSRDVF